MNIKPAGYSTVDKTASKPQSTQQDQASHNLAESKSFEESSNMSVQQVTKRLMNGQILAAQEKVMLSAGNESMALLFRSAIDAIDAELDVALGENTPQKEGPFSTSFAGIDYSPSSTASRIVTAATGYFALHQQQQPDLTYDEQLTGFMEKISAAIDVGFGQAKDILSGLNVLNKQIAAGIEETYALIQTGLDKFKQDRALPSDSEQK
ncbi:DUF5610 domain-containing protein [Shewanella gaetbuli]